MVGLVQLALLANPPYQSATMNQDTTQKVRIDIWSDVVCPFCYLGKHRLEDAIKKLGKEDEVEIVWHSFRLYPDFKPSAPPENAYQYLARVKHISIDQSKHMHQSVENMAAGDGLHYRFDKTVVINSFDAHRLIQMAKERGVATSVEGSLFSAYFTEGKNLSDIETLVAIGKAAGMPEGEVRGMLQSDKYATEVAADVDYADRLGISGVPFFVFNSKFAVSGAQPVDTFVQALQKAFQ